jgi:hypothetical protein
VNRARRPGRYPEKAPAPSGNVVHIRTCPLIGATGTEVIPITAVMEQCETCDRPVWYSVEPPPEFMQHILCRPCGNDVAAIYAAVGYPVRRTVFPAALV